MQITCAFDGQSWQVDLTAPRCVAIPLDFYGPQPNAFGLPRATAQAFAAGSFIGDLRQGGSANCEIATLTPHGNGTHTECVGHITFARIDVHTQLQDTLIPALLISIPLCARHHTADTYPIVGEPEELMVTQHALSSAMASVSFRAYKALIIRTWPNTPDKRMRCYSGHHPPYFSLEAMSYVRDLQVQHLLVDIPSVDRESDEGRLATHHLFWSCQHNQPPTTPDAWRRTITEMIYVPDDIPDGPYLLNLQIAPFVLDAAPSRPILFALQPTLMPPHGT